jgi:hypothetical protein
MLLYLELFEQQLAEATYVRLLRLACTVSTCCHNQTPRLSISVTISRIWNFCLANDARVRLHFYQYPARQLTAKSSLQMTVTGQLSAQA